MAVVFRKIAVTDAGICAALDNAAFGADMFPKEMLEPLLLSNQVEGMMAVLDDTPIGYALVSMVADEGDLLSISIAPEHQGKGYGEQLLKALFAHLKTLGTERLFLEVRESNAKARGLYQKQGGAEVGLRKNYYDNPKEHAVVIKLEI